MSPRVSRRFSFRSWSSTPGACEITSESLLSLTTVLQLFDSSLQHEAMALLVSMQHNLNIVRRSPALQDLLPQPAIVRLRVAHGQRIQANHLAV